MWAERLSSSDRDEVAMSRFSQSRESRVDAMVVFWGCSMVDGMMD